MFCAFPTGNYDGFGIWSTKTKKTYGFDACGAEDYGTHLFFCTLMFFVLKTMEDMCFLDALAFRAFRAENCVKTNGFGIWS